MLAVAGEGPGSGAEDSHDDEGKTELRKSLSKKLSFSEREPSRASLEDLAGGMDESYAGLDGDDDTAEGDGASLMRQDQDLWRSIWSQGRGVLCSNRHMDADYLEMEDELARAIGDADASSSSSSAVDYNQSESKRNVTDGGDRQLDWKDVSSDGKNWAGRVE